MWSNQLGACALAPSAWCAPAVQACPADRQLRRSACTDCSLHCSLQTGLHLHTTLAPAPCSPPRGPPLAAFYSQPKPMSQVRCRAANRAAWCTTAAPGTTHLQLGQQPLHCPPPAAQESDWNPLLGDTGPWVPPPPGMYTGAFAVLFASQEPECSEAAWAPRNSKRRRVASAAAVSPPNEQAGGKKRCRMRTKLRRPPPPRKRPTKPTAHKSMHACKSAPSLSPRAGQPSACTRSRQAQQLAGECRMAAAAAAGHRCAAGGRTSAACVAAAAAGAQCPTAAAAAAAGAGQPPGDGGSGERHICYAASPPS